MRVRHEETGAEGTMTITVRTVLDSGEVVEDTMTPEVLNGLWDEWEVIA